MLIDEETSMSVMKNFETLLTNFPGIISASSFGQLEKWANKTAEDWNRLSPYDDQLRLALPRFLQMLDHQLKSRKMANLDRIDWGEFKAYLNKNEQWLAKKDIPVYMSSLIAFSRSQLEALADAEGMTGTASSSKRAATVAFADPNDNSKRQRFEQWGAQVATSINGDSANPQGSSSACSFCGRHHSLAQCRGVQNLIAQHKSRQLAARGGISKPPFHRGSSWRTKKHVQFGTRARPPFADRGGRSGGGNGGAGSNSGGRGGHWGNGHRGRRSSPSGRPPRGGFSPRPSPRFHTNNVSVPEQGDDAAVRQIVQANSASPHFVGAAITSAKGKEPVESPPTVSRKQRAAESDESDDLIVTFTSSDEEEEEKKEYSETDIFGTDYSSDTKSSDHDDQEEVQESSDHDDQEEAQALTAHDELIAVGSVMNDMLDAETSQPMQQERLKADEELKHKLQGLFDFSNRLFITLPEYTEGTKFQYDISPANLCDHLCNNTVSPEQVYTVLSNTHINYLVQVQAIMKERFDRLDFEPAHELQIIAYANFINNQVHKCTGSTTPWINFVPWSKHAWLWSEFIVAPPDPPDPPDIPEVSLDEVHAAFAATLPALTVSDTACAQVDAAAAAFADSVSDAINIASRAASALDATSKAQAFALNAASKAASAFDYNTTSAATEAAAGACFYSRCVVPPRCTYLLYSTSLKMPICRIHNPIPYVSTPPSHGALEKGIRGGEPSAVRSAPCSCASAQSSAVAPSREPSVLALATTDIPVSPHTSNGEILAIVDSGTSKHILQCRTLLANAKEAHVAVSSFAGDTSRSTYSGDLLCTVRTENGQLLPPSDTSSALVVPDAKRPLWSVRHAQLAGHEIVLGNRPGLLLQGNPRYFVPFINCPDTGLWLIRLLPPPTLHNRIYPIHLATNSIAQDTRLQDHERLGHISFKRMRQLDIDGITPPTSKRLKPITCPVCITAKARRANRPAPSTPADRPTEPWQDVYTDLSGKVRTASVTGAKYFAVFVDSYSGSKHIEFMNSKNHFIFGYKRFVSYLGRHPKTLRSDQGTEILNKELTAYLEANHTNHIVCSKDEHASIGAAENSIGVLRTSAKAMMLAGNIPKRYWQFVVSHAAYLNNIVAPSRCDRTKTIFEILFGRRADVRRIPPIGAFCAVYSDRRQLQDQSFGLTSKQGVFIGIARYKKVLGYVVTDGKSLFVTRDHITFDPQLFPFKLKPTSSPDWQTFYNLTNPVAEGAVLHKSSSATPENPMPDYASDESDLDPDFDSSQNPESADINDTPTYESSSDDDSPDNDSAPIHTEEESPTNLTRPSRARQPVQRYKTTHTPRPPRSQTPSEILWHTDPAHRQERLSWIGKDVSKFFPTHGTFKGKVQQYHYASDNYTITYEDNDVERVTYSNMKRIVPGTPEYADHQSIVRALHVAFTAAVTDATSTVNSDVIPNSYKEARASIEAAGWQQSMDVEMTNLRKLGCWTVIPRSSLPPNTPIMGTRWTYRKKTDENGTFTRYRGRLVAKGFSQILGVNYFESFSPVASFVTIRTLFALTALPMFKVYQYDVQVAFIQSVIDPNHPPVYCEPAEGYEDRRHYVYQLHKHLYGMKDSPRGWSKLFTSVCLKYGFSQLKSDECVFVKIIPNTKSGQSASTFSAVLDTLPNVPEHERIYKDCPYESCLIILCTYVDDILAFTNCQSLADDFLAHCNKRFTMTCDGEAHWYLSVKYTRDPSGAVSASQELYIDKILKRWGMESCKPLPTPFPAKSDVVLDELLKPIEHPDPVLNKQFQEIIGQLLYCQQQTVPEISWSVSILARFTTKAGAPHMALAKKVLRYLQGRKRIPLRWCARSCQQPHLPGHIYGYADASFADIKPDRLSSMGYVFIINNGAVSWRSTRTPLVTLSAAESEVIALSAATQEAVYLRKLANELGFTQTSPTTLYEDCTAAVALSKENRFRNRSKHIALRWSFVSERQHPSVGDIQVISVSRKIMLADIFASPRPAASFIPFRDSLLGRTSRITPLDSRDASTPDDDASSD